MCLSFGKFNSYAISLQQHNDISFEKRLSDSYIEIQYQNETIQASTDDGWVTEEEMIKESEAQGEALRAYKLLTNTFPMREDCSWIYPEEYGGAYIDDNNSLVIALVDRTAELEAEYRALCGNSEKLLFKDAAHSLADLEAYASSIGQYAEQYAITNYGVDEEEGTVVVGVESEDVKKFAAALCQTRALSRANADFSIPVVVKESEYAQLCATELIGGSEVSVKRSNGTYSSSICIGGKFGGKSVIITAGHAMNKGETVYYGGGASSSKLIGSTLYSRCGGGQTGDFAIVEVKNNYTATNKVKNINGASSTVKGVYSKPPKNTEIYKYGFNKGYAKGKMISSNESFRVNNDGKMINVTGMCAVQMESSSAVAGGDSGGSVYTYYSLDGGFNICGSVSGFQSSTQTMYYSPLIYAENLGFSLK